MIKRKDIAPGNTLRWAGDKQLYLIVSINDEPYKHGGTGVVMRRYIQSRGNWAKTPVAWTTVENMLSANRATRTQWFLEENAS